MEVDTKALDEYPEDITGLTFGYLTVIGKYLGEKNANSLWVCACGCGSPRCKKIVVVRRGLLTRKNCSKKTCGANYNNTAFKASKTKLLTGKIQKNSTTNVTGVTKEPGGKYRSRIDICGKRIEVNGLSFENAVMVRNAWEQMKKAILFG
uniref:hypothetical protein n=1 Tax=uncultured Flavonifractor sp. TaxID=1193534 RepID=UPI0026137229|nr:hypothetical protein [uncultured Flavonifractor sp.]